MEVAQRISANFKAAVWPARAGKRRLSLTRCVSKDGFKEITIKTRRPGVLEETSVLRKSPVPDTAVSNTTRGKGLQRSPGSMYCIHHPGRERAMYKRGKQKRRGRRDNGSTRKGHGGPWFNWENQREMKIIIFYSTYSHCLHPQIHG